MSIEVEWQDDGTLVITCGEQTINVPPKGGASGVKLDGSSDDYESITNRGTVALEMVIGDPSKGVPVGGPKLPMIYIDSADDITRIVRESLLGPSKPTHYSFACDFNTSFRIEDVTKELGAELGRPLSINLWANKKIP